MKTTVRPEVSKGEHLVHASIPQHERGDSTPYIVPPKDMEVRGETELPGLALDELTDRLLSRFRHILVDEYQDIDESQYELISALAGRTDSDPDRKLTILAVGDDDQNIYTWRGANVEFIQRFREDYAAEIHYLVENYRSTGHIIAAANALIAHNRDRMKTDHPICRDHSRAEDPPGGALGEARPPGPGTCSGAHHGESGSAGCGSRRGMEADAGAESGSCMVRYGGTGPYPRNSRSHSRPVRAS